MAPSMAAVLRAPRKLCSFSYVLFVILLFYVLDVVSITVYDRHTLLNIGSLVAQRKPDFEFLNAGALFTDTASEPFVCAARPQVKSSHLYLYSAFNNTDCVKALNSIKLEDRVSVMYNNKIKHSIFS